MANPAGQRVRNRWLSVIIAVAILGGSVLVFYSCKDQEEHRILRADLGGLASSYGYWFRDYLPAFYDNPELHKDKNLDLAFSKYMAKELPRALCLAEPAEGYKSFQDLYFTLSLPRELKTDTPVIICYTNPLEVRKDHFLRMLLVLDGETIDVVFQENEAAEDLIGPESLKKHPSLFYWHLKLRGEVDK